MGGCCEQDRGRRLERWIIVREVTPAQLNLAGAAQLALLIRTVTEKGKKPTTTRQYFVTSRPAQRLDPAGLLALRRAQWGIECDCHQRLDVSQQEDRQRVRSRSVSVLGLLCRISLALFEQWCQQPQPVRDKTYPVWSGRLKKQPRPMLELLIKRCLPP